MVRITQNLLNERTLINLQANLDRLQKLQEQLSTGRRINRPSDDPIGLPRDLRLRWDIMSGRRFVSNIDYATTDLQLIESTLAGATESIQRARELALQGATDLNREARLAIAEEIGEILNQIIDLANSKFQGRYIFAGSETQQEPFQPADGVIRYTGDSATRDTTIGTNTRIGMGLHGLETFLHTPNKVTSRIAVQDVEAPLASQLALAEPNFPNVPPLPSVPASAQTAASPNPTNYPGTQPDNYATFTIYGREIRVDLSQDSLRDLVKSINATSPDVIASIDTRNRLVITSRRTDALQLVDGPSNPGFPPQPSFGLNLLSVLGMHRRIEFVRNLDAGYPASDPLSSPPAARSNITLKPESLLFASANTGPPTDTSVPFPDNLALIDLDENVLSELEGLRITIDQEVIDIDLRPLSAGSAGADQVVGTEDDIQGSNLRDLIDLINNDSRLAGKAVAYINRDGTGIGITATRSTDVFKVENIRKMFGRDLTTRLTTDPGGVPSITRVGAIDENTRLADLPGALTDGSNSLGIRLPEFLDPPLPDMDPIPLDPENQGLVTVINGDRRVSINLGHVITIGDVLRAFNESTAGVRATINESRTGINIESVLPDSGQLQIIDVGQSTIARDLGLVAPPPPRAVTSDLTALVPPRTATDPATSDPGISPGSFTFSVADGAGRILGTYTVSITATDTFQDVIDKIDALDGSSGPGEGLFSMTITSADQIVLTSNFDGHVFHIDRANDTSGFVAVLGLDQPTFLTETEVTTLNLVAISQQDTASVLGLAGEGTVDEIEEKNVFRTLQNLHRALLDDDIDTIQASLSDLDTDLDVLVNDRTVVGARLSRLESTKARLEESELFLREQLSLVEDADVAELITELTTQENVFQAALAAAARVLQPTLMDFLR